MLQQTQVARVVPVYERFVARFPTPTACADAPVGGVVRAWSGLGYNRRAVNLHRAATAVVERHGGDLPTHFRTLLALPGIGPYTARAVLAFSSAGEDVGVVDTNAARVLARAVAGRPLAAAEAQHLADSLVPPGLGWTWNAAVLDLGATVCTSSAPRCHDCPVSRWCAWTAAGSQSPDPRRGSVGVTTPQSSFVGSDRQGRGRLVAALRHGPVALAEAPVAAGWPGDVERTERIVATLVADGLARRTDDGRLTLP